MITSFSGYNCDLIDMSDDSLRVRIDNVMVSMVDFIEGNTFWKIGTICLQSDDQY